MPSARPVLAFHDQPLFRIGGVPLYLATLLVVAHVLCLVISAIVGTGRWEEWLAFLPSTLTDRQFWRFLSYPFAHDAYLFWFVAGMFFLIRFGIMLEKRLGRVAFAGLYLLLIVLPPVTVSLVVISMRLPFEKLVGTQHAHLFLLVAAAFSAPRATIGFPWLRVSWLATFFVAVSAISLATESSWGALAGLGVSVLGTVLWLRICGLRLGQGRRSRLPERRSSRRPGLGEEEDVKYEAKLRPRAELGDEHPAVIQIDVLLEKISRSGLSSLTDAERQVLEKASEELKAKDRSKSS